MSGSQAKSQFYGLALLHSGALVLLYTALWQPSLRVAAGPTRLVLGLKVGVEILASFYFVSAVLKSLQYLLFPAPARTARDAAVADAGQSLREGARNSSHDPPPIACIYLCAGDLEPIALESLTRLEYPGRLDLFVHDDSIDPGVAREVDECVRRLGLFSSRPITVLRRPTHAGGKPGAVNYVLSCLGDRYPVILLADCDSTAIDSLALTKALKHLGDPRVAAVQFRSVGVRSEGDGAINRQLRRAVEVFDLFARHQARHGMGMFLGHNALLRTAALRDAGGLREGVFADDIDLSVRLLRRGWRILYAPEIVFGETHPVSYEAFRRRAYKWAFGCGQVLRDHLVAVLLDRRLSFSQKFGFLEFTGFYAIQALLIFYLVLAGLVLPWVSDPLPTQAPTLFLCGLAIVLSIFLPSLAYHVRHRHLREWWPFALICAVVYGGVAFASARGLVEGISGARRTWVPTNRTGGRRRLSPGILSEALFGASIVLVPAWLSPGNLWQPSLYLFAAVFLLTPFVQAHYVPGNARREAGGDDSIPAPTAPVRPRARLIGARPVIFLATGVAIAAALFTLRSELSHAQEARPPHVSAVGERILIDGDVFQVKGVHYSPWLPGTGPMKDYRWPGESTVAKDLAMIQSLGANTILVHDAPRWIFPLARRYNLMVIDSFFINWQSIGDDALFETRAADIEHQSALIASEPNLLAILLGNEVLEWVLKERGAPFIEDRLRGLYDRVKKVAPRALVGHANWPVARGLRLSFMDLSCFNLYPAWPREVVVAGYGHYIESVLKPIAAGRPLLITEFGQNSLEATEERQGQVLRESWEEIRPRTAGGVVFEFADEWWKNYDNPIRAGDWWQREYAPNDEATHDLDPEEYYGIVTSERNPKPAFDVVRRMYAPQTAALGRFFLCSLPLLALFAYTLYVFRRDG